MKHIDTEELFLVELTKSEVEAIRDAAQNHPEPESKTSKVYLGLFVGMSRLCGRMMNDDGSFIPQPKSSSIFNEAKDLV